jgi:hypothetical protein
VTDVTDRRGVLHQAWLNQIRRRHVVGVFRIMVLFYLTVMALSAGLAAFALIQALRFVL